MSPEILRIITILLGLALLFAGLPIYRGTIKVLGFIVGASYGVYLFSLFAKSITLEPIFVFVLAGFLVLFLGFLGTFIAQLASAFVFFLAGGLVGVIIGKLVSGIPAGEIINITGIDTFINLIKPEASDLLWFLGGGIVFILSIDIIIMFCLAILGAGLIWVAISPFQLMKPDWVIPLILAFLGIAFQEGMRRRASGKSHRRIPASSNRHKYSKYRDR